MNKYQALHKFWNSFGWKAYDENTVPDNAELPYITYEAAAGSLGSELPLSASLWQRSTSWNEISEKAIEIERKIKENGHLTVRIDNGLLYINAEPKFSQRMAGGVDNIRRIILNIKAEFLTAY